MRWDDLETVPPRKKKECKQLEVFSTLADHHGTHPAYVLKFQNTSHFLPSPHHFPIPTIYQSTASICKGSPTFLCSTSIRCCISSISALLACCSRIRRSSAKLCSRFCMRSWRRCNAAICWELVSASKDQGSTFRGAKKIESPCAFWIYTKNYLKMPYINDSKKYGLTLGGNL